MIRRLIPDASDEEIEAFDNMQMVACSGEFLPSALQMTFDIDVTEDLPKLKCPTLIVHSLRDGFVSFEEACRTASLISGAQLEPIDSANNFALPSDPQFPKMRQLMLDFAKKHG